MLAVVLRSDSEPEKKEAAGPSPPAASGKEDEK
jgi:hypothetical protein